MEETINYASLKRKTFIKDNKFEYLGNHTHFYEEAKNSCSYKYTLA